MESPLVYTYVNIDQTWQCFYVVIPLYKARGVCLYCEKQQLPINGRKAIDCRAC